MSQPQSMKYYLLEDLRSLTAIYCFTLPQPCNHALDAMKAICHSFLGLLLLLIYIVFSEVPKVQTRPIDFVCNTHARRNMNNVKDLEVAMGACVGSDPLPSSIQIPCVRILKTSWEQKSLLWKHAEVRGALRVLLDGVGRVRTQTTLSCQSSLLEQLEHGVRNYLLIVTNMEILGDIADPVIEPDCPSQQTQSLTQVLLLYRSLLRGKLEWLSLDLRDSCLDQS